MHDFSMHDSARPFGGRTQCGSSLSPHKRTGAGGDEAVAGLDEFHRRPHFDDHPERFVGEHESRRGAGPPVLNVQIGAADGWT